jgi:hypothetical protein
MPGNHSRGKQLANTLGTQNPYRTAAYGTPEKEESFRDFSASELYCPKCGHSMPVRQKMLLVLPGGELYDYTCARCGTSVGTRRT